MSLRWRTTLYLSSVLFIVLLLSIADFMESDFHRSHAKYENTGKQYSLIDTLSEGEKGIVEKYPAAKIIAGMKINVNKAGVESLSTLPGISWKIAENILKYRETHGLLERYEDLLSVKGIKEKRLRTIRPFIEF